MTVEINPTYFANTYQAIKDGADALSGVNMQITTDEPTSFAMPAFKARVEELTRLMNRYQALLQADVEKLHQAGNTYMDVDAKLAELYKRAHPYG